jgi:phage terminase small subunit
MKRPSSQRADIFINEYLVDFNATRASFAAGYKHGQSGRRLLQNVAIKKEIERRKAQRLGNLEITSQRVLAELARCAFFDVRKLYHPNGTIKKVTELDSDTAAVIQGIKFNIKDGVLLREYKLTNRQGALEMLAKHLNLFDAAPKTSDHLAELLQEMRAKNDRNVAQYGVDDGDVGDGDDDVSS